jgi:hypothetical protein
MHWTTACTCGQTLRLHDAQQGLRYCPACEAVVSARPPRPARRLLPRWRKRWWLAAAAGVLLVAGLGAVAGARWYPDRARHSLNPIRPVAGVFPMAAGVPGADMPPKQQAPKDFMLRLPETTTGELFKPGSPVDALAPVPGRIAPLLGLADDPDRGLLLAAGSDGVLRCYSRALELRWQRRLPAMAYRVALDARRGLLYAALAAEGSLSLGTLGELERAYGDVHVFALEALLEGRPEPRGELAPVRKLGVHAHFHSLLLSADGDHLYYLADGLSDGSSVGRVVTASWQRRQPLPIQAGGLMALARLPGSSRLAGLAGGRLFLLDPQTWAIRDPVMIDQPSAVQAFAAGPDGQVYLAEWRNGSHLVIIDLPGRKVLHRLPLPLAGWRSLCMGPDGRRLYASSSAVLNGGILALDLASGGLDARRDRPRAVRQARRDRDRLIRGPLFLSADGKLLVTGNGHVFHSGR